MNLSPPITILSIVAGAFAGMVIVQRTVHHEPCRALQAFVQEFTKQEGAEYLLRDFPAMTVSRDEINWRFGQQSSPKPDNPIEWTANWNARGPTEICPSLKTWSRSNGVQIYVKGQPIDRPVLAISMPVMNAAKTRALLVYGKAKWPNENGLFENELHRQAGGQWNVKTPLAVPAE